MRLNNIKMGLARTDIFNDDQNKIAMFAKIFCNPARVAILQHLFKMDGCYCGDLVEEIGLAQPTISQHLKELKNVGLVKYKAEGTSVCYCVHSENWIKMSAVMNRFVGQDVTVLENQF